MTPDKLPKKQLDLTPVDSHYVDQASMISDQLNQYDKFIYFDGISYWEYLGTTIGTIADYRKIGGSDVGDMPGAGAGLSIDGNGDIQLGDANSVVFSPRTDISNFDADFLIRGKSGFYYEEIGFSIDSYQLIGQNNLEMLGPNGALYEFNEVLDGSADFNRQVAVTDNLLQNSVFFRF